MDLTKCTLVELRQLAKEQEIKNVTKLIINDSIKYLVCSNCEIKEIELTFNLQLLEADNNTISKIELSDNLIEVSLLNNPLEYVSINKNLKTLKNEFNYMKILELK